MPNRLLGGIKYVANGADYVAGSFIIRQHLNVRADAATASALTPIGVTCYALISATGYIHLGVNKKADNTSIILPPGITGVGFKDPTDKVSFLGFGGNTCDVSIIFPGGD